MERGTLIRGIGSFYTVLDRNGREYTVRCRKKFRHEGKTPLVGDEVCFSTGEGNAYGWLEEILPRKSVCLRPPVSNVKLLLIVVAPVPEPDLLLTDRQISRAIGQNMNVMIAVNKCELEMNQGQSLAERIEDEYTASGFPVLRVSAKMGTGLEMLRKEIRKKTEPGNSFLTTHDEIGCGREESGQQSGICCVTGQSGVGKSTLLNALLGLSLETGDISQKIGRGKNTTRHTELICREGLRVVDTAGFNLLEAETELEPGKLKERYPEFRPYEGKCRFRECQHDREPGCAVTEAMEKGVISEARVDRYRMLLREARENWKNRFD